MAALVDVNVLIALLYEGHAHNGAAVAWLESVTTPGAVAICRVAQMGVLRIMTSRAVLRDDAVTPRGFWRGWDRMMSDDRFAIVDEATDFETTWRDLTGGLPAGAAADTDVYLAAFALAGSHSLVTFDRGFRRFRGIELELLSG